jgi:HJR/Mrr/RecB family endonuclease
LAIQNNVDFLIKLIIECKRYGRDKKVGLAFVQRLLGVKIAERANKALLVTTASFTTPAKKFENEHFWDLELKDYTSIITWANEYTKRKQGITHQ